MLNDAGLRRRGDARGRPVTWENALGPVERVKEYHRSNGRTVDSFRVWRRP